MDIKVIGGEVLGVGLVSVVSVVLKVVCFIKKVVEVVIISRIVLIVDGSAFEVVGRCRIVLIVDGSAFKVVGRGLVGVMGMLSSGRGNSHVGGVVLFVVLK